MIINPDPDPDPSEAPTKSCSGLRRWLCGGEGDDVLFATALQTTGYQGLVEGA